MSGWEQFDRENRARNAEAEGIPMRIGKYRHIIPLAWWLSSWKKCV